MKTDHPQYALCVFIVPGDKGSRLVNYMGELGVAGGTIITAKGTSSDKWMQRLQLAENHKDLVFIAAPVDQSNQLMKQVASHFKFEKANRGIGFVMPLQRIVSKAGQAHKKQPTERVNEDMQKYQAIYTIVNLGDGGLVVKAAADAGAKGGTIIHGRGAGDGETAKIFAIELEPEKEIVLILVKAEIVDEVCAAILDTVDLEHSKSGILFVQDVISAYGLVQ